MISAYFTRQRFVSIEILPKTDRFKSAFFTGTILPSLVQAVNVLRLKMQAQGYWLQIHNAMLHNSALSLHKTEELEVTRLPQPPYSPDLAPYDFFLFDYLKREFQGMNFRFQNGVISAVTAILGEILVRTLSGVFDHGQEITQVHYKWWGVCLSNYQ
jgi:histone-lysine N-methyltransferase SETMAR